MQEGLIFIYKIAKAEKHKKSFKTHTHTHTHTLLNNPLLWENRLQTVNSSLFSVVWTDQC